MYPPNFLFGLVKNYLTVGIIGFAISFTVVRGPSMTPTLNPHSDSSAGFSFDDRILIEKFCLNKYSFSRGDVVVFRFPSDHRMSFIKRIVGLPGDRINLPSLYTIKVPEGHCWVVGDNSARSRDSRNFGSIPLGLIYERVTHIIWPPHRIGAV